MAERITGAAICVGIGRHALTRAAAYSRDRGVWGVPIGTHQGVSHPLAKAKIEVELAALMTAKAAWRHDHGQPAAEASNMAKYAAAEAALATAAESAGFGGLWTLEAHTEPCLPLVLAAEHTSRIRLGTAVAVALARNPLVVSHLAHAARPNSMRPGPRYAGRSRSTPSPPLTAACSSWPGRCTSASTACWTGSWSTRRTRYPPASGARPGPRCHVNQAGQSRRPGDGPPGRREEPRGSAHLHLPQEGQAVRVGRGE